MTYYKNEVTLEGFLAANPKFKSNTYGRPIVELSITTQNSFKCSHTNEWQKRSAVHHKNLTGYSKKVFKQAESFGKSSLVKIKAQLVYDKVIGRDGNYFDVPRLIVSDIQEVRHTAKKEAVSPGILKTQRHLAAVIARENQRKLAQKQQTMSSENNHNSNTQSKQKKKKSSVKVLASILGVLVFFV